MKTYHAAIFLTYAELAEAVNSWTEKFFHSTVTAGAEQDESDWGILLSNLHTEDHEKFNELFQQYDTVGDYDPDLEWPINPENPASLPVWVSNRIIEEIFNVSIERCAAVYDGVYFLLSSAPAEEEQDKDGICPVCGAEIEYDGDEDDDGNGGGWWDWECPKCGASGRAGFDKVFDRHYNVVDKNGDPIPGRPE